MCLARAGALVDDSARTQQLAMRNIDLTRVIVLSNYVCVAWAAV